MIETLKSIPKSDRDIDPKIVTEIIQRFSQDLNRIDVCIPDSFKVISENVRFVYVGDSSMFYTPMGFEVDDSFIEMNSKEGFTASIFAKQSVIVCSNLLVNICEVEDCLMLIGKDTVVNFLGKCVRSHILVTDEFKDHVILNQFSSCDTDGTRFYVGNSKSIPSVDISMFT